MGTTGVIEAKIGVIGGGPAGSAIALRLAQLGHAVVLLEAASFPRHHVGEALPMPILSLLESFGLRDRVEQSDVFRSGKSRARWQTDEAVTHIQQGAPGLQVNRADFDALLLNAAVEAGVRTMQPVRAAKPQRGTDGKWLIPYRRGSNMGAVSAEFVIDATGRRGLMSRAKRPDGEETTALYGYWQGAGLPRAETLIDTLPAAWLWGSAVPGAGFNAMAFIDRKDAQGLNHHERRQLYLEILASSPLFHDCIQGQLVTGIRSCDASAFHRDEVVGKDFLKVGEAAFALDPLSSQGVLAALTSALHGSLVANTLLSAEGDADAAIQFYNARTKEAVTRNREIATERYGAHPLAAISPFWQSRGSRLETNQTLASVTIPPANQISLDHPLQLADGVRIVPLPVVTGDRIARRPAITHPDWDRPIAFLRDLPVGRMLAELRSDQSGRSMMAEWSRLYGHQPCRSAVSWLCGHGILVSSQA